MSELLIDPHHVTNFKRSDAQLQAWFLFCPAVAGKTAVVIAAQLDRFLWLMRQSVANNHVKQVGSRVNALSMSPFELLAALTSLEDITGKNELLPLLKKSKIGKYSTLEPLYRLVGKGGVTTENLRKWDHKKLDELRGFGPKTARMFVLHSRRNQKLAVPDTHVLAELRERGYDVPKSSPNNEKVLAQIDKYVRWESERDGMSMGKWDLHIWRKRTKTKPVTASE